MSSGTPTKVLTRLEAVDSEDMMLCVEEDGETLETIAEDSSNGSRNNSEPHCSASVKLQVPNQRSILLTKSHSADANGSHLPVVLQTFN